jgi:hypothetical protein
MQDCSSFLVAVLLAGFICGFNTRLEYVRQLRVTPVSKGGGREAMQCPFALYPVVGIPEASQCDEEAIYATFEQKEALLDDV